ncbi:hypothetical protein [Actinokineospora sp.]|uniref:hypothetical protein n=1 Tax=Actinokineospora sp. TaxID=1872133 RepID=UPI004037AE5C
MSADWVEGNFHGWVFCVRDALSPADRAAAYEQWADFYQWRLVLRAQELAGDRVKRHVVAVWTEEMTNCCRRCAAYERGEDPGEWVPLWERRPDLDVAGRAIVAEIIAESHARGRQAEAGRGGDLRKAG